MMTMKKLCILLILVSTLQAVSAVHGQTPEERGMEIAIAFNERDSGWKHFSADLEMILRNRAGKESRRRLTNMQLEVDGDGDKSLSLFREPKDVAGTAMLTFSHGLEPDDQWLYLPAIKRVKRISSRNKSGPFMGSEVAYEDLGSPELEKYTYKYLGDESCGEFECYKLERFPQYEGSGYTRHISWVDKAEYRLVKIEFYDRKNSLLKTMELIDYNEYTGGYWRADRFEVVNHQTGKSTTLNWSNYDFETKLDKKDFTHNALKRLR